MPGIDNLYTALKQDGLYTKSLEEFKNQFSTPESIQKLHTALRQDNLYTKPLADFQNQFFGDILKKKEEGLPLQPLADGGLLGTSAMAQDQQLASSGEGQLYDLGPIYQQYQQQQAQQPKAQEYISFEEEAPKTGLFGEAAPVAPAPISLSKAELTEFMPFVTTDQIIRGYLPENYDQLSAVDKVEATKNVLNIPEVKNRLIDEEAKDLSASSDEASWFDAVNKFNATAAEFTAGALDFPWTKYKSMQMLGYGGLSKDQIARINKLPEEKRDEAMAIELGIPVVGQSGVGGLGAYFYSLGDVAERFRRYAKSQREKTKEYDTSIQSDIANGNIAQAAFRTATEAIGSIPYTLAAMTMGPAAGTAGIESYFAAGPILGLGAVTAVNKIDQELKEGNTISKELLGTAVINGLAEGVLEGVGSAGMNRLARASIGNSIASKQISENIAGEFISAVGLEGTTEGLTSVVQEGADALVLGKPITLQQFSERVFDAALIGAFSGGGMSAPSLSISAYKEKVKPYLEVSAMTKEATNWLRESNQQLASLQGAMTSTNDPAELAALSFAARSIVLKREEVLQGASDFVDNMTNQDIVEMLEIKSKLNKNIADADAIKASTTMSEDAKKIALENLKSSAISLINKRQELVQRVKNNAVQKQTTSEVPVQPEARVGEEMAEGAPETKPEVVTEEGKVEENIIPVNEIEDRRKETESKIEQKTFLTAGKFSRALGKSNIDAVPVDYAKNNGIEFVKYANPETGSIDVVVTGTSAGNFVGFYRLYEDGKPTNKWSSKLENASRNKENLKIMLAGVQSMLPIGHEYTEKTSISTDGLRFWNQQLDRGYELQYDENGNVETTEVRINGASIVNDLGVPIPSDKFSPVGVYNDEQFNKVKEAVLPYIQKLGLNESNIRQDGNVVKIDLPILKKNGETKTETKPKVVIEEGKVEEVTPEFYVQELDRTKVSDPTLYWSVDPVELETAKSGTIVSVDGGYGFVSPEGDIKGVFKTPETTRKGVADDVLKEAVKNGGIKLDNFDTYLTKVYKKNGFRIASRMEFAEEFAPKGWNKEVHGTPDVVAMVYDPNNQLDIEEKTFDNYDKAMAYRDSFVEQARALQEAPAVEQITVTSTPSEVKQSIDAASTALGVAFPEVEFIVGDKLQDTKARIVEALTPRYGAEKAQAVADGFTNVRGQALFAGAKPIAIVINKTQANNRTAGHEAWEVMLNDAFGQNPEKFAEFRKAIDAQLKVSGYEDVAEALTKFSNEYADQGTEAMFREYMAEFGGMLVEGGLDPKNLTQQEKTLLEKIKDIINKFALELTGKEVFLKDATPENIIDFMVTISEKVSKGETVEQFFEEKEQGATEEDITARKQVIDAFDGAMEKLGIQVGTINPKTGKSKVTNYDIASAMNEYYEKTYGSLGITDFSDNAVDIVSDYAKNEILFAMSKFGSDSGKGWYTEDYAKALDILSKLDSDIKNNPAIKEAATAIIAVASNSTAVYENLTRVIYGIDQFKKTRKVPTDVGTGKGASAIASGIDRYNNILKKFNNDPVKTAEFLQQIDTVSNLSKTLLKEFGLSSYAQAKSQNLATDPEWNSNEMLPMSVLIFGPKIGAFYSNLSGLDGTPTIDRWCIRTIYRYKGDMRSKVSENEMQDFKEANGIDGVSYSDALTLAQEHSKLFQAILGGRGKYKGIAKAERNEALKPYRKGDQIWKKAQGVVNDISEGIESGVSNKKQYAKDFRSFTKKAFEAARDKIAKESGQKLSVSDIQAILWIYEKNLFGHLGVKQREDATYSSSANRLVNRVNDGVFSLEQLKAGDLSVLEGSDIETDGAMGDKYGSSVKEFKDGIDNAQERNTDTSGAAKKKEVKLTTEEIETLNDNFGIQDGEIELSARSQKINPSEVKALSSSLNNLDNNELESLKDLIHKDVKAPNKTQKAYKLFKVKKGFPGELFPLFVGANESVTTGDWIAAKAGELTTTKEGKTMVKSTLGPLAYRPGWHSGEFAIATHIGSKKNPSDKAPTLRDSDQVWAEVEVGDDFDWQTEANNRAEKTKDGKIIPRTAHITDQLPALGNYKYKTNSNMTGSWIISGEMKVNRVLTDKEVAKINEKSGSTDLPRVSPFDFDAYGFNQDGTPKNKKQVLSNQVARAYIIAKETGENPNLVSAVESATTITARSQKINYKDLPGYDRMRENLDGVIEKAKERGANKARILEDAIGYLQTSKVYEIANDSQREQMVRDIKKELGERIKSAPRVHRVLGIKPEDKILTTNTNLIAERAKAAKYAEDFMQSMLRGIGKEAMRLKTSGKITAFQMRAILNKASKVKLVDAESVRSFIDYLERVMKNAEFAERAYKLNNSLKIAKRNAATKIGIADGLSPLLQKVFSLNAYTIPKNVFNDYAELVETFSERRTVLGLTDIDIVTNKAKNILSSVEGEIERVKALEEVFSNYQDKEVDKDGKLMYSETISKMVADGSISPEDGELLKKYKSLIMERTKKDPRSEEEIEEERLELVDQVKSYTPIFSQLPTVDERNLARSIYELIKTGAIDKMSNKELKDLLGVLDNIENGFLPHYAQIIKEKMNQYNRGEELANAAKNAKKLPFEGVISRMKVLFGKENSALVKAIERNPLFFIDELFGNFNTRPIFNSIFKPVSQAYSKYQGDINTIMSNLDKALSDVAKSYLNNPNKTQYSKQKMMAFMLQREYQSNIGDKAVNSAKAFLDETINYAEENDQNTYSKKDIQNLKDIRNKFFAEEEIDLDAVYETFNKAEKRAIEMITKINDSMSDKVSFTSAIIRGRKVGSINKYIHHNVLMEKSAIDDVTDLNIADLFNASMKPSTKAKSLEERTGKVTPLVFDPFSSTVRGAKYLLMDYHLTEPIRTARRTLNYAKTNTKGEAKKIVNAISRVLEQSLSNVLANSYTETSFVEDAISYVEKTGYRAMLASVPRAFAELASNLSFVALYDPKSFIDGMGYSNIVMSQDGLDVMRNVNSEQIERLYPGSKLSGKIIDKETMSQASGIKAGRSLNDVANASSIIYNNSLKKVKNVAETTSDYLISTPDKIVMKPLWFGSFAREFKAQTGIDVDFNKIAKGDEVYLTKYRDAIRQASAKADETSVRVGASDNPFTGILKGANTANQGFLRQAFNKYNNFMTRFLIYEYSTARTGVYALMGEGKISRAQGAAIIGASLSRMIMYSFMSTQLVKLLLSSLFGDEEEDDDTLLQDMAQASASALTGLLLGRNFGNVVKAPINIAVEKFNEKYLDSMRTGEYDPYKDAIQYTVIPKEKRDQGDILQYIKTFSGAFSPAFSAVSRAIEVASKTDLKTEEARERRMKELTTRTPLEIMGNLGFVPLYKDLRRILIKDLYKDLEKGKSESQSGGVIQAKVKKAEITKGE